MSEPASLRERLEAETQALTLRVSTLIRDHESMANEADWQDAAARQIIATLRLDAADYEELLRYRRAAALTAPQQQPIALEVAKRLIELAPKQGFARDAVTLTQAANLLASPVQQDTALPGQQERTQQRERLHTSMAYDRLIAGHDRRVSGPDVYSEVVQTHTSAAQQESAPRTGPPLPHTRAAPAGAGEPAA